MKSAYLSVKKRGFFSVSGLPHEIHLFAVLHADVDVTFLFISFPCAMAVEQTPNGVWGTQDTFYFVHTDLQIQS